jgi:nuclear transport factor 2 (NTF2) superfamily protein
MLRHPIPPFSLDSALAKVQAAADVWNTRDAGMVIQDISPDSVWRDREESFQGRAAIEYFLERKWAVELHYRLMKELWAYTEKRISVRFEYEWQHAKTHRWFRSHGNEHWEFDADGFMTLRDMSANDILISPGERRIQL